MRTLRKENPRRAAWQCETNNDGQDRTTFELSGEYMSIQLGCPPMAMQVSLLSRGGFQEMER
jgi:hypothetical protein